jgi:hypothetical protein
MKAIIWGYPLHSHTHSYIHHGFFRAFRQLGFETHWFNDESNTDGFDFSGCLFLTAGQQEDKIPSRKDCFYVLHNCPNPKYEALPKVLRLNTLFDKNKQGKAFNPYTYYKPNSQLGLLAQPWATDLLPDEIDSSKTMYDWPRENTIYYVGSYHGYDDTGTIPVIDAFKTSAKKYGVSLVPVGGYTGGSHMIDCQEAINMVKKSFAAPALQCRWQVNSGYIPCRIFKNISYGHLGITHSPHVASLFGDLVVYDPDPAVLCDKSFKFIKDHKPVTEAIELVKRDHTYLNRIRKILEVMGVPGEKK